MTARSRARTIAALAFAIHMTVLATAVRADDDRARDLRLPGVSAPSTAGREFPTPLLGPLTRAGLALGALSLVSGGLAWWARRRRTAIAGGSTRIEILAAKGIGPRHQVVLLDVGGHRILVGTAGDHIAALADLSESPSFEAVLERERPAERRARDGELLDVIGRFEGLDA